MAGANVGESELSHRLKVLTWNVNSDEIDGGTPMRLQAVIREIEASAADIIFLQEVTANFKKMLELQFGSAFDFEDFSQESTEPFFIMIMLRKSQITSLSRKRIDFQGGGRSGMGRFILSAETRMKGSHQTISLMTTHLESGKENSAKRMLQYEQLLHAMLEAPASSVQICGGDLNLREAEDRTVRKRLIGSRVDPNLAVDAFDAAGRPYEGNCTWRRKMDKTANAASVQARFDRQLFRSGQLNISLVHDSFSLLGLEDVAEIDHSTSCKAGFTTPSDHMGILCEYSLASGEAIEFAGAGARPPSVSTGSPTVIVLIGPPGSGKSTLSALLSPTFARISQDALGSRAKCHAAAAAALESGGSIVVDRCNADEQQRSTWLSIAKPFTARTVAVHLDVPLAVCAQRVAARQGHEGRVEGNSAAVMDVVSKIHGSQTSVADNEGFDHILVFPHTVTLEHAASELLAKFGKAQSTSSDFRSKPTPSASAHRPYSASFSERARGVQSDSSSDDVSPDRSARSRSLPLQHAPAPAPSPPAESPAHVPCDQTVASDNDCVLVQHVPPRPKRPLPGSLAPAAQPIKVKRDPDASDAQCLEIERAPEKKKRGRNVKNKTAAQPASFAHQRIQVDPQPSASPPPAPPPPEPVQFQFTAEKLLKAATLYLATHPFLDNPVLLANSNPVLVASQKPDTRAALATGSFTCQSSGAGACSQFTSQPQIEAASQSQGFISQLCSGISAASQSQRFDLNSVDLEASSATAGPAMRSSTGSGGGRDRTHEQPLALSSHGKSLKVGSNDYSDIMSDDFEINFMNSLLPRTRSQIAEEAAASNPPPRAFEGSASATTRWNTSVSGVSLKEIADRLCTSTRRE